MELLLPRLLSPCDTPIQYYVMINSSFTRQYSRDHQTFFDIKRTPAARLAHRTIPSSLSAVPPRLLANSLACPPGIRTPLGRVPATLRQEGARCQEACPMHWPLSDAALTLKRHCDAHKGPWGAVHRSKSGLTPAADCLPVMVCERAVDCKAQGDRADPAALPAAQYDASSGARMRSIISRGRNAIYCGCFLHALNQRLHVTLRPALIFPASNARFFEKIPFGSSAEAVWHHHILWGGPLGSPPRPPFCFTSNIHCHTVHRNVGSNCASRNAVVFHGNAAAGGSG